MRVTLPLGKESYRWVFKQIWLRKGVINEPPLRMPKFLADKDIEITDPRPKQPTYPPWEPPVKDDPRFISPPHSEDHPDYHEDYVYEFSRKTRLLEGEKQALILMKTQPFYELPENVQQLIGTVEIPDQDELIQRYIMQANAWDPTKKKLPRRFSSALPGWRFKAEMGIPYRRIMCTFTQNLLRLCQSQGGRFPDLLQGRRFAHEAYVSTSYNFQGSNPIWIRGEVEWLMSANRPLAPFTSEEVLDSSVTHSLPDMFPVAPTIDLKHQHVWRDTNITGWRDSFSHPHPHTLFLITDDHWSTSQRNARALAYCFAHALATARSKYGRDTKTLPEPVSTQCVMTDGATFHFVCFQLNTLNFDSGDGVKNLVWFDNNNEMYKKILPNRTMLRNTKYEDYDPEVFRKMLALYVNGAHL
ncbi:39S ribosomal protein L37, mitochondrial [Lamellibrachia satsuma]|nr:39S ribosomal protein L37, mitochondrial [Lamellibrachia satsuma]